MTVAWWITLVALLAVGAILVDRYALVGVLVSVVAIYAFLQVSSNLSLVPWYKDGGNGAGLADWWIWLLKAATFTGVAWVIAGLIRLALTRR